MRVITQRSAILMTIATFVAAATHLPLRAFEFLSHDKALTDHTIFEARLMDWALWLIGGAAALAVTVWRLSKPKRWRRAIEDDYIDFVAQGAPQPPSHRVSVRVGLAALLVVFVGLLCTIRLSFHYHALHPPWYHVLAGEHGLWESLTALCLLAAGATLILGVMKLRGCFRGRWALVVPAAMGAMFVFGAGEEVSWGQHGFGLNVPEALSAVNVQNELNVHNIGGYWANDALAAFLFGYVILLPVLTRYCQDVRYVTTRLSVPMVPLALMPYGLLALFMDDHHVLSRLWGNPPWRLSEARETIFSVVVCCTSVHTVLTWRRRLQGDAVEPDVEDSPSITEHRAER